MAVYKSVLNGNYRGQDIKNILYYRTGVGIDIGGLTIGGTADVNDCILAQIVPTWLAVQSTEYTLQDITTYAYHDGPFNLVYQNPTTLYVGLNGLDPDPSDGPAQCAILKFNLENTVWQLGGPKPPKRGYLALGPLTSAPIDNDGRLVLNGLFWVAMLALCNNLATNLVHVLPPAVFFPIRVHHEKVNGILSITSIADVNGCAPRQLTSFRRSRMSEA